MNDTTHNDFVFDPRRGALIPRHLARYGSGKDAYLRRLTVSCTCCGARYALLDSESPALCQTCYDAAGEENARIDAGG